MIGYIVRVCLFALGLAAPSTGYGENADPTRDDYLALARSGWVFDLHSARMRRPADLPPVRFDSVAVAKGEMCLFGDRPHALHRQIIHQFTALLREVYGRRIAVTFAGRDIANCPPRQRVYIRLYSGRPPSAPFNADLRRIDDIYDIRLPPRWRHPINSPAQTVGFFGSKGAAVHLLINQPPSGELSMLERDFYTSIFVEELFQAVSFGADILKFDRQVPFYSKLQEMPVNLRYLPWQSEPFMTGQSEPFMTGLLQSNPKGLCGFDVFMLHALATAGLETANSATLLVFIDSNFDRLRDASVGTLANPAYQLLFDPGCQVLPD